MVRARASRHFQTARPRTTDRDSVALADVLVVGRFIGILEEPSQAG
jgi:hypothetical protein